MNNNENEISDALIDVRKAFRLLHAYQERVLDIIKYVSKVLNVQLLSAWPWYTDTDVKGNKVDLDNWSFDWLKMYLYEFVLFNSTIDDRECKLSLIIVSDTGFFDSGLPWTERNKVNLFNEVQHSSSQIVFIAGLDKWHKGGESMMPRFQNNANNNIEKDKDGVFLAKTYPLARFFDSDSIDMLLKEFSGFCAENGIDFIKKLSPLLGSHFSGANSENAEQ